MKFSVGYQLTGDSRFSEAILRHREQISEVYFSWGSMPNGRHAATLHETLSPWEAKAKMEEDLSLFRDAGISFNLLLNGACYGDRSLSKAFFREVCETVEEVGSKYGLTSVTTTAPPLAHLIKVNFPDIATRASVNMGVATPSAAEYLAEDFDGFYLPRELNRDLPKLEEFSDALEKWGKTRHILANSGCLNHCPARSFHDNLVAHEAGIAQMDNAIPFRGLCAAWLENPEHRRMILSRLNLIRPEDLWLYEDLCDSMKLATRVSPDPTFILNAYTSGVCHGNLLDLTEPNHAGHFYPIVLENDKIPRDYGSLAANCAKKCDICGYCGRVYDMAATKIDDFFVADSSCS